MSLIKPISRKDLQGLILQVNHAEYGTLFAAMIEGSGTLVNKCDEEESIIPFLTTEQILQQIAKFGFYVKYDVKSNLPDETLTFLNQMMLLRYDKITRMYLQTWNKFDQIIWQPSIFIFKSCTDNTDMMTYDEKLTRRAFVTKAEKGVVLDVTDNGVNWDWVTSLFNISDIIDENLDPKDEYETDTNLDSRPVASCLKPDTVSSSDIAPEGFTMYDATDDDCDEEPEDDNDGLE